MNDSVFDFTNDRIDKTCADVLLALRQKPFSTQRALAESGIASLGAVNAALRSLREGGYLTEQYALTSQCDSLFSAARPKRAILLAAGSGIRMAPLSELPKGLLMVQGERLVDRLIGQLHAAGVRDITIVTGFMKEKYEYLIDRFGVKLVYNGDYVRRNNLHSLALVADQIDNAYILPSDIWFDRNPFPTDALYPWYLLSTQQSETGEALVSRKQVIVPAKDGECGYDMVGIAYLCARAAEHLRQTVSAYDKMRRYQHEFWESALLSGGNVKLYARFIRPEEAHEINTFEDLRALDYNADQMSSQALDVIERILHVTHEEIRDVSIMKNGMTNRSFLFSAHGRRYIMRIPGEGSNVMIDRRQEHAVYEAVSPTNLCDHILYIDPETGYKITEFWEDARVCDPLDPKDVTACMRVLRQFHTRKLTVPHVFDPFERIDFYESLYQGTPSVFPDYAETKAHVRALLPYIEKHRGAFSLTHIDAVPDNFLFIRGGIRLIDWEYASMQDPHLDIAMFAVYAMYDRAQAEALIDSYFPEGCEKATRAKLYCYIAVCGLLWSNWCEYKRTLGVEFGEYALRQYRFAKEYYPIALSAIGEIEG